MCRHAAGEIFLAEPTPFGYLCRSVSFATLTVASLSSKILLYRIKIPGALTRFAWSYAIYLTHKQIIHVTQSILSDSIIAKSNILMLMLVILFSLFSGWLLYTFVETPFLKLIKKYPEKSTSG
ncbi:TPA: hypothetical protein JA969_12415 [Legionella pneumophila]|nr:hypothetical protein [Legionella pneumophila]HAT8583822.1 hypothetical protein [Legionella pneumophila]